MEFPDEVTSSTIAKANVTARRGGTNVDSEPLRARIESVLSRGRLCECKARLSGASELSV